MKKNCLFLLLVFILAVNSKSAFAQISGTNCFLQGQWLEIGVLRNGAFGASGIPAGYHPHEFGTGIPPAGTNLAEVYDQNHDGWTTGAPPYMGDYTYPGSPFEGWGLQVNVGRTHAFVPGGFTSAAGGSLTGAITGYSNTGGRAICNWAGTAATGGMQIRQETRVDTLSSWVVVTTVMRNTTAAAMPGVYYLRSCDPDNNVTWAGGMFNTNNICTYQNDTRHRVLVSATSFAGPASYFGLGTKDCRAKAFIYDWWSMAIGVDFADMYNQTVPAGTAGPYYYDNVNHPGDIGIGLVYNIGTIAAGDSAIVSYAYVFNNVAGLDEAFPDPMLVAGGTAYPVIPPPQPNYDTFDVCAIPGMTTLPVDILFAEDKCWSWSKWTWSPALGLATTTGCHNVINTTVLPPNFTYTITGTDSAFGMSSCNTKTFYLTIITCNGAEANSPCAGDTLWLNAPGDSTGATYGWYGPAPSTAIFATTQKAFIFPASTALNGLYAVIKTVAGLSDTAYTTVTVRHRPTVWASSNSPLCLGAANTLLLTSVTDSPSVTYAWSKIPPFYSSTLQNPTVPGFTVADTGIYQVIVTSVFGCKDTDQVHVTMIPPPPPPVVTAVTPYCQNDPFVPFTISGLVPGGSVLWYGTATGGVGSAVTPTVNTAVAGVNKFYFSQISGSCEGLRDSITIVVNPIPAPIVGPSQLCQYFTINLTNPTTSGIWSSSNPSVATIGAGTGLVTGVTGGTVTISYTLPTTCRRTTVVTVHPKPAPPTFPPHRECQYVTGTIAPSGPGLTWYGLGVTPGTPIPPTPNTDVPGTFTYYVTFTSPFGCVSDSAAYPVRVFPEPPPPVVADTVYCQGAQVPALTAIGTNLLWYTTATSTPGVSAAPVPSTVNPGVKTYFVTQTIDACESPRAGLNVTILYTPDFRIKSDRPWVCQFDSLNMSYDGPEIVDPAYTWSLPFGSAFVNGTNGTGSGVTVRFDTAWGQHHVILRVSNYGGKCYSFDTLAIKVVPAPDATAYVKPDICLGDTTTLALSDRSPNSHKFTWLVDGMPMLGSPVVQIVSANSNTGGPFVLSWHQPGRHIVNVQGFSVEGCKSQPTNDTVNVHELPDSRFTITTFDTGNRKLCIEDSVLFKAVSQDYANSYKWEPEHFFANENKPNIWGKVELARSMVTLTVTDPYGCTARSIKQINPDQCCTVSFPNAFTPNNDGRNDLFRPIFQGYHRFHIFRVSNRWGQTIFESANSNPAWDGIYNGVPQDMGTYFYYIKYDCGGKVLEAKGDITLIR